jgi:hypothetical protein
VTITPGPPQATITGVLSETSDAFSGGARPVKVFCFSPTTLPRPGRGHMGERHCKRLQSNNGTQTLPLGKTKLLNSDGWGTNLDDGFGNRFPETALFLLLASSV